MRGTLALLTLGLVWSLSEAMEAPEAALSPAKKLLQALGEDSKVTCWTLMSDFSGKQTNGLDTNIDELFYQFLTSDEKSDIRYDDAI